jgi:hypothetical protein
MLRRNVISNISVKKESVSGSVHLYWHRAHTHTYTSTSLTGREEREDREGGWRGRIERESSKGEWEEEQRGRMRGRTARESSEGEQLLAGCYWRYWLTATDWLAKISWLLGYIPKRSRCNLEMVPNCMSFVEIAWGEKVPRRVWQEGNRNMYG